MACTKPTAEFTLGAHSPGDSSWVTLLKTGWLPIFSGWITNKHHNQGFFMIELYRIIGDHLFEVECWIPNPVWLVLKRDDADKKSPPKRVLVEIHVLLLAVILLGLSMWICVGVGLPVAVSLGFPMSDVLSNWANSRNQLDCLVDIGAYRSEFQWEWW